MLFIFTAANWYLAKGGDGTGHCYPPPFVYLGMGGTENLPWPCNGLMTTDFYELGEPHGSSTRLMIEGNFTLI